MNKVLELQFQNLLNPLLMLMLEQVNKLANLEFLRKPQDFLQAK